MSDERKIRGATGEIRWGYMVAATVGPWSFEGDRTKGTLTAQVVSVDAFKAAQQPLTFHVPKQGKPWRWPVESLQIAGQEIIAELGPIMRST